MLQRVYLLTRRCRVWGLSGNVLLDQSITGSDPYARHHNEEHVCWRPRHCGILLVFSGVEGELQSLAESRRPDFVAATPHDLAEIGAQLIVLDVPRAGRFLLTILFRHSRRPGS